MKPTSPPQTQSPFITLIVSILIPLYFSINALLFHTSNQFHVFLPSFNNHNTFNNQPCPSLIQPHPLHNHHSHPFFCHSLPSSFSHQFLSFVLTPPSFFSSLSSLSLNLSQSTTTLKSFPHPPSLPLSMRVSFQSLIIISFSHSHKQSFPFFLIDLFS